MSCTAAWSFKAKDRTLQIEIKPKQGSNPTFTELGMRIVDRANPPGPTETRQFSASQLAAGVEEPLVPAKRYEMLLVTVPVGAEVIVTIALDDGNVLVDGTTCKRGDMPITGNWSLTTWRP